MAGLRERGALAALLRREGRNQSAKVVHPLPRDGADHDPLRLRERALHLALIDRRAQVALGQNHRVRLKAHERLPVLEGKRLAAVHDQQANVRAGQRLLRALHADALHRVARLAQTRRVRQAHADALDLYALGQRVARSARHVGDDGALLLKQRVHQAALAGVRPAAEHDAQALVLNPSGAGVAAGAKPPDNLSAAPVYFLRGGRLLHLVREVDRRGDFRHQVRDLPPGMAHERRHAALHLADGAAHGALAPGADHPHDGLRLRQVDAPV